MSSLSQKLYRGFPVIGGSEVSPKSESFLHLSDPATGEIWARIAAGGIAEVSQAISSAEEAFKSSDWFDLKCSDRAAILYNLAQLIRHHRQELASLESRNVGKPIQNAQSEVIAAAECFEYYAGAIGKVGGLTLPLNSTGYNLTLRQPLGVCVAIVPWNYPLMIAAWKIAPALAMGNTVVLKPASLTPITALRLGLLALEAGLPAGVLNILPGDGNEIGEAMVCHPLVQKVSFTGSTEVGKQIVHLSATGLKRTTLELGGKSAAIVFADANLQDTIPALVRGILGNAGQDCCARSRLLLEKPIFEAVVEQLAIKFKTHALGHPLEPQTKMGPLISLEHRERVRNYIKLGQEEGAKLVIGGNIPQDIALVDGAYFLPTIFQNVHPDAKIAQQEIFGPVLCIIPFETELEAIEIANNSLYGLSGSIWTQDLARALRVAKAVRAGVLSINSNSSIHLELPFGGVKQSGFGKELGLAALDCYSEIKSVFINT
ncbi:MAG: aldehyde dehydrogenase family protein [Cyanobacteria bacterium J06621_12]